MLALYVPALIVAFLITVLEMTEVVALVFALSADTSSVRHGALGAVGGTATVGLIAVGFGAVLIAFPKSYLLWASAVVLAAFGVFLFRSTLKTYRRRWASTHGASPSAPVTHSAAQFAGGFSVGAVEATEAVVVLLALTAAGYGFSALVGALLGGAVLVAVAVVVHDQIRKIKVPWLKVGGTSLIFAFSVFWAGEALGVPWPGSDLFLIPLVAIGLLCVRGGVGLVMRLTPTRSFPAAPTPPGPR